MVACKACKNLNLIKFFVSKGAGMCPRKAATAGRIGT